MMRCSTLQADVVRFGRAVPVTRGATVDVPGAVFGLT